MFLRYISFSFDTDTFISVELYKKNSVTGYTFYYDGLEEISKSQTYAQFLDSFVTEEDKKYLEDEELARDMKELYSLNKGEILLIASISKFESPKHIICY